MTLRDLIAGLAFVFGLAASIIAMSADKPTDVYLDLRAQALAQSPATLGVKDATIGVLMETGYPEAVATLVAFIDGSASMYFSTGGGMIGAGQHEGPAAAARALVQLTSRHLPEFAATKEFPLPGSGRTRFYVITGDGVLTAEAAEEDLGEGRLSLSPVFHAAHELIFKMRQVEERR